jgi:hypothetical protein
MQILTFTAIVTDAKWGDTLWQGTVEAADVDTAQAEAVAEYRAYVKSAYDPRNYKSAAAIVDDVSVKLSRRV